MHRHVAPCEHAPSSQLMESHNKCMKLTEKYRKPPPQCIAATHDGMALVFRTKDNSLTDIIGCLFSLLNERTEGPNTMRLSLSLSAECHTRSLCLRTMGTAHPNCSRGCTSHLIGDRELSIMSY